MTLAPADLNTTESGPVVLYGFSWERYEALIELFGDDFPALRVTYLNGTLEITKTSREHELIKTLIARLLEIWAFHENVRLTGIGAATFRKQAKERGLEPDECYVLGELGEVPDIAIEIVKSRGVINKMDVYSGLDVPEVWVWENQKLAVFRLVGEGYEPRERSVLLPELDIAQLSSFVSANADQSQAVRAYFEALEKRA